MKAKYVDSCSAKLTGIIIARPQFYKGYGQKKKIFTMEVKRDSGYPDRIQIMTEAYCFFSVGDCLEVEGELRSRRDRKSIILYVVADKIRTTKYIQRLNAVEITGTVVNDVKDRMTPAGRKVADIMVAVNRKDKKTSYIPCIIWGHKAEKAAGLTIGSKITLSGRIQSRNYMKNNVIREINEVSIDCLKES